MQREIIVHSADQTPVSVTTSGNITAIKFDSLTVSNGIKYNIKLTVYVKKDNDNTLTFTSTVENNDDVRVNEIQLPFIELGDLPTAPSTNQTTRPNGSRI